MTTSLSVRMRIKGDRKFKAKKCLCIKNTQNIPIRQKCINKLNALKVKCKS